MLGHDLPLFAAYSRAPNENPLPQWVFSPKANLVNYFKDHKKNQLK